MNRGRHMRLITAVGLGLVFVCAGVWLLSRSVKGQETAEAKKVLVLYWDNKDFPGNVSFDQGFQVGMRSEGETRWEIYSEYLDTARFPEEHQNEVLHEYLLQKYEGKKIDVVVASPDPSLRFLLDHRKDLFPNTPIVFVVIKRPDPAVLAAGPGMTGIIRANTHRKTVDLALHLQPDTKQLFVVSGSPELDKRFETAARQELAGYEKRVNITYLTDLPVSELVERVKNLPKQSIILYVWQRSSVPDERALQASDVLQRISAVSPVPIYGMGSRNVGLGLVGGYVQDSERNGLEIAEIVRRILNGTRAQDIPVDSASSFILFDWRQLQRWNISEEALPGTAVVRYKELTFWDQYKWRIIGVIGLFILQSLIIAALLVERRRRRQAKLALAELNADLEQRIIDRTAALDAKSRELETFAYSVAHDLKAPLRGIQGYSRLLLEEHAATLNGEGSTFLNTIQNSAEEMDTLIEDLLDYSRLERRELKIERIELKRLVESIVEQKQRESAKREVDVVLNVNGGDVAVDINGLTQALRNYVDNAFKFTQSVSGPRIEVGSKETANGHQLWVRDNGVGFDMKHGDRIFEIFQRLNRPEEYPGTGIGLAIVRKAMERMGGRAWAESQPGQGATFYLEIPTSQVTN